MTTDDMIDTGLPLPRIRSIRIAGDCQLEVEWADGKRAGRKEIVDLSPAVRSYRIYRALREEPKAFETARLDEDGYVVAWQGDNLEMTADMIEALAEETMSSGDFAAFLERNRLTQEAAAALLGRSRRQIGYYLKRGPVPRIVALACFGYESRKERRSHAA